MCIQRLNPKRSAFTARPQPAEGEPATRDLPAPTGSRRRRLWDLPSAAHGPVVGVCLPIQALRRLVDKQDGPRPQADDYALHGSAVNDCRQRGPVADASRRELDRHYLLPLRSAARAKTTEAHAARGAEVPGLQTRRALPAETRRQGERIQLLARQCLQARHEAERARRITAELAAQLQTLREQRTEAGASADSAGAPATRAATPVRLDNHAVLCVGGRAAAVPLYRLIIERSGARFIHHDGGAQDSSARLDATLAAADLVICQTGCVSHNAYWRVKDHCRRTGKRCVFVETPSTAGLKHALVQLAPQGSLSVPTDAPADAAS